MYYNIYIVFLRADIVPLDDNTGVVEFVSIIAKRLAIVCRPAGDRRHSTCLQNKIMMIRGQQTSVAK